MPVFYDKRNKCWRFQCRRTVAGRIVRTSKLLPAAWTRTEAEAFDRTETARLFGLAAGTHHESPGIERAVELYLAANEGKPNFRQCSQSLALIHPYYAGKMLEDLSKIGKAYARDQEGTLAPATIRNRIAYLRAACRWAWRDQEWQCPDPGERVVTPAPDNERQIYITPEMVHKLASHADEDTGALIRLTFYTGLRWAAEVLPRRPEDVITHRGVTYLRAGTTKNGEPRMVPVHPNAVADLKYLPFLYHWRTYYTQFEKARLAIGMPELVMHDLRHSLASAIVSDGGTLKEVQGALGHKTAQSANRYAHLYPERLREVLWKIRPKIAHKQARKKAA